MKIYEHTYYSYEYTLSDIIETELSGYYGDGAIENLDYNIRNLKDYISNLTQLLVEKNIITDDEVFKLLKTESYVLKENDTNEK